MHELFSPCFLETTCVNVWPTTGCKYRPSLPVFFFAGSWNLSEVVAAWLLRPRLQPPTLVDQRGEAQPGAAGALLYPEQAYSHEIKAAVAT